MAKNPKALVESQTRATPATATMNCLIEGGIVLRVFDMHRDEIDEPRAVAVASITLQHGANPGIEPGLAQRWFEQNAETDFVKNGLISLAEEGND